MQACALIDVLVQHGRAADVHAAWNDATERGKGWRTRAVRGWAQACTEWPDTAQRITLEAGNPVQQR